MQSITLELRPRLQTCHAFIQLQRNADPKEIQVKLLNDCIRLSVGKNVINYMLKFVEIITGSLSSLNVTDNWIYFRVHTKSESVYGSFKTEILTNSVPKTTFLQDSLRDNESLKESDCIISCACCKNVISNTAFFKRVLPLPDLDYDPSEWFCCKHDHNVLPSLLPQEFDLFYGSFSYVVHASLFNGNLRVDGETLVCNRCLRHLGKVHENDSFKLWSCCVEYNSTNHATIKSATDPLADFLAALRSSATGIGEEVILQSFAEKETHCLTVKPMDWELGLLQEPKVISEGKDVCLRKISVIRVWYKYETSVRTTDDRVRTKYCEVGLPIMEAGLKHLTSSSKRFPKFHRMFADYYIGNIDLSVSANEQ